MSQQLSSDLDTAASTKKKEAGLVEVTDKKLVVLAILMKIPWVRKTKSFKTMFYFDKELWRTVLAKWQSPEPSMYELKEFFNAEEVFNSAIHDDV